MASHGKRFGVALAAVAALGVMAFDVRAGAASGSDDRRPGFEDAVGSWFGRAVPVPGRSDLPARQVHRRLQNLVNATVGSRDEMTTTAGCARLGQFSFIVRRVKVH